MQAKTRMRVLVASVLIAMSPLASGQTTPPPTTPIDTEVKTLDTVSANKGQAQVATKIASNFTRLAGSTENALKLVQGLRNGTAVTLTSTTTTTTTPATGTSTTPTTTDSTITPATGKMGWGNVKIALALAQDSLARAGITNPTTEQLNAALNGGDITVKAADGTTSTVTLKGVLQMRADGMGWGQIAQAGGTKVGPVVSQLKMSQKQVAALPTDGSGGASTTTTAAGTATTAKAVTAKGVTTAAGTTTTTAGASSHKGITTASGVTSTGSGSRGLVTAGGVGAGQSAHGNAYGRGVVTAAGGGATSSAATMHGKPSGAGVVTATGSTASSVTTASGNGGGNGGGNGKGNGGGNAGGNGGGRKG